MIALVVVLTDVEIGGNSGVGHVRGGLSFFFVASLCLSFGGTATKKNCDVNFTAYSSSTSATTSETTNIYFATDFVARCCRIYFFGPLFFILRPCSLL